MIDAALTAWRERNLPLASVEGFVRQILGWREFVRACTGWTCRTWRRPTIMVTSDPARLVLTGRTRMACMRDDRPDAGARLRRTTSSDSW